MANNSISITSIPKNYKRDDIEGLLLYGMDRLGVSDVDLVFGFTTLDGVMGQCYGEEDLWYIDISNDMSWIDTVETIFHELAHINQESGPRKEEEAENESRRLSREYFELL